MRSTGAARGEVLRKLWNACGNRRDFADWPQSCTSAGARAAADCENAAASLATDPADSFATFAADGESSASAGVVDAADGEKAASSSRVACPSASA
ncbi:MAG: hypothetical protein AB8I69_04085 [Anaerolineae bacterium]